MGLKRKTLVLLTAAAAIGAPFLPAAHAAAHVTSQVPVTFTFSLDVSINCDHTGNTVTISGPIGLGSSEAYVWYQNNVKGTHQTPAYSGIIDATLTPSGGSITVPKQPSLGGSGGNPWIWYDALDGNGPMLVGRCVNQAPVKAHFDGARTVTATLDDTVTALDCSKTNSDVNLHHVQSNPEVDGKLIFDNNVNKPTHPSGGAANLTATLVDPASFAKDADLKAGMGNPLVYILAGSTLTPADALAAQLAGGGTLLGRCNQL
jgi:hypothetical protein